MAKRVRSGDSRPVNRKVRSGAPRGATRSAATDPDPVVPPSQAGLQPPLPVSYGPAAEAVAVFERAMQAMQRHDYPDAASLFRSLIGKYPAERALLDRARVYVDLCDRELRKRPAAPRTIEERLTAATAALNDDDVPRAEQLAASVLRDDPKQDLALYLLAAIAARRGASDAALSRLREAIQLSPEAGAQARFDPDFESLFEDEAFRQLTEPPPQHSNNNTNRRARKGRPER